MDQAIEAARAGGLITKPAVDNAPGRLPGLTLRESKPRTMFRCLAMSHLLPIIYKAIVFVCVEFVDRVENTPSFWRCSLPVRTNRRRLYRGSTHARLYRAIQERRHVVTQTRRRPMQTLVLRLRPHKRGTKALRESQLLYCSN